MTTGTPLIANTTLHHVSLVSLFVLATATALCVVGRQGQQRKIVEKQNKNRNAKDDGDDVDDGAEDYTAKDDEEEEPVHSILHHFAALQLDPETTVEEANKRRTASYYLKAREAHAREIVRGVPSRAELLALRRQHVERTLRYSTLGTHSHRTVVVMCDASTATLLDEARRTILSPLEFSHDLETRKVWIPPLDLIPQQDMHVTVAIPWWWHSMREGNLELSEALAARFRQTLFLKFHHPFQVELQRFVLLGGQTLVALWRSVGERVTEEGHIVYDRHGECVDPFVRLRVVRCFFAERTNKDCVSFRANQVAASCLTKFLNLQEIVRCFTEESSDNRLKPLTYQDVIQPNVEMQTGGDAKTKTTTTSPLKSTSSLPSTTDNVHPPTLTREHSIQLKTPGLGSGDGFIHTTLCRLPLHCLSQNDVSLAQVHRLCRELTASMSGKCYLLCDK